jgi:two-component system sensor histidine kinase DevS
MAGRSPFSAGLGEGFLWSLLDAAPDTILLVDDLGRIVFVHEHGADLFGYPAERLLELTIDDLLPADRRPVHRAHRARYRAEPTVRAMGSGLPLRARRADGTELPVEVSLSPLAIGDEMFTVAAVRDISERVRGEDYLRRVLHTLDASDDGVFIFDATSLRYSYVNQGAVRLTGYSHDELAAMTPLHLNPGAQEIDYRQVIEALDAEPDQAVVRQTVLLRKDGAEVPVEKTYQSAPAGRDGTKWVIALARDSSARLRAEAELRRSQDALRDAEQIVALAEDRQRIARDLHDTVIQRLFGAGLHLQATLATTDERTRSRLETTINDLDETINELRTAIFSLQGPSSAAPGGVRGRLLDVVRESRSALGFEPQLQFDGPIETIDDTIVDHLTPTLREALANIARHAGAHRVRVGITATDTVTLTVTDDGTGLPEPRSNGRGLTNLADRATALGGTFTVTPAPGGGTLLRWQVPSDQPSATLTADL